jgi:hypothetical protein
MTGWMDWREPMFAARWAVLVAPLLLFWTGAWLRKSHRVQSWSVAGVLALFSICVSVLGATDPFPRGGYDGYTALAALRTLTHGPTTPTEHATLAGR